VEETGVPREDSCFAIFNTGKTTCTSLWSQKKRKRKKKETTTNSMGTIIQQVRYIVVCCSINNGGRNHYEVQHQEISQLCCETVQKKNMDLFIFWPNFALEAFSFFSPIGTIVFPFNLCLFA
jgi:hypothetical protein